MTRWLKKREHGSREGEREPIYKDLGKKVLALLIAISLWLVANLQHDVERNVAIDINYTNLPPGLVVLNNPPEKLNIRARGPRSQLSSISPNDMIFTVDLSNVSQGAAVFEIRTDMIIPPRDVQVTGVSPSEIRMELDKLAQKEVAVAPKIGPPDTGYEIVGEPEVSPGSVRISGPASLLDKINEMGGELISLEGEKSSFSVEIPLRTPYSLVNILGRNTARITINLKETILEKEFNNLDINFVNFGNMDYETVGNVETEVAFEGPYSIINKLNSKDIELYVDGSGLAEAGDKKTHRLDVNVEYPHKGVLKMTKQSPKTINIRLN